MVFDLFTFVLVAGGCGLLVFGLLRRVSPLRRWGNHGNVFTGVVAPWDLCVAGAFLAYYYASAHSMVGSPPQVGAMGVPEVVLMLLWQLLLPGALVFYLGVLRRIDLGEFYGARRLPPLKVVLWSVGGMLLVAYPLVIGAALANGMLVERAGFEPENQLAVRLLLSNDDPAFQILLAFSAAVVAPLSEEVIFRGFLYPVFKAFTDRFFATFFSAATFALVHYDLGSVLPLFALGISFAVAFELTGCLWVPIGMHALFNLTNLVLLRFAEEVVPVAPALTMTAP
ncbi:hypothetical protein BH23VER1_BH23VER1_11730 [soil metagenome]